MKKFLALVLALVMTLGLATVGTNAATAYKDANDINYKEAVEVMSAVGVLKGDENGFRPGDTLKRSEGAKIIAYLLLGNKTAESIVGSGNKFTDVPASHWACGYIEYLASIGVVSGVGDGKFAPDATLTGVQFTKMLLVALGYDAELEELVGSDWSINTQKLANMNDLFAGMENFAASETITREQAAQCCLNALKADMVKYADKGTTVKIGESTVVTGASNAEKDPDNSKKYNGIEDGRQLVEYLYGDDLRLQAGRADDFGAPANKWIYKNVEVGTFAADSDIIYTKDGTVKTNVLYDLIGKNAYDNMVTSLKDNDEAETAAQLKVALANDLLEVWVDGVEQEKDVSAYFIKNTSKSIAVTGNSTTLTVYKQAKTNSTDKYTIIVKNVYVVKATDDYNKTSEYVNIEPLDSMTYPAGAALSKIEQEDFDVSGVKDDDYLLVTIADGEIKSVAPATTVKGKVESWKVDTSVTVDGTKYEYNKKISDEGKGEEFDIGSEAVLILDNFGFVVYVAEATGAASYAYLQDIENNKSNNATLYFTDGTTKTVTVKKIFEDTDYRNFPYVEAESEHDDYTAHWYAYSVDDAGRYTLKALDEDYSTQEEGPNEYAPGTRVTAKNAVKFLYRENVAINAAAEELVPEDLKANTGTVVIVLDDDENVTVYTGVSNIPAINAKATVGAGPVLVNWIANEDDGFAKYVFIDASAAKTTVDDSASADNYVFVLKDLGKTITVSGDKEYKETDILLNGELVKNAKIKADNAEEYATGKLYKNVKSNSDEYYTTAPRFVNEEKQFTNTDPDQESGRLFVMTNAAEDWPISYSNGVLSFGEISFMLDGNVKLIYAKGCAAMKDQNNDYEVNTVSGSSLASALKNYVCKYDVFAVASDKDSQKITALYVYVYECYAKDTLLAVELNGNDINWEETANVYPAGYDEETDTGYFFIGACAANAPARITFTADITVDVDGTDLEEGEYGIAGAVLTIPGLTKAATIKLTAAN